jgi:hypothetical protein
MKNTEGKDRVFKMAVYIPNEEAKKKFIKKVDNITAQYLEEKYGIKPVTEIEQFED